MPEQRQTLVHHFTHIDNVPALLAEGALIADSDLTALAADVGDPGVKSARRRCPVPIQPGGVVADYVPFYFAPGPRCSTRSPAITATGSPIGTAPERIRPSTCSCSASR